MLNGFLVESVCTALPICPGQVRTRSEPRYYLEVYTVKKQAGENVCKTFILCLHNTDILSPYMAQPYIFINRHISTSDLLILKVGWCFHSPKIHNMFRKPWVSHNTASKHFSSRFPTKFDIWLTWCEILVTCLKSSKGGNIASTGHCYTATYSTQINKTSSVIIQNRWTNNRHLFMFFFSGVNTNTDGSQ